MRKILGLGLALGMLIGTTATFASPADAKPWKKRVNARQEKQKNRIKQGVKSGELNKKEAKRLRNQQRKLNKMEKKMRKSGGGLTKKEAAKLDRKQDQLSKNIKKQKNDAQKRK